MSTIPSTAVTRIISIGAPDADWGEDVSLSGTATPIFGPDTDNQVHHLVWASTGDPLLPEVTALTALSGKPPRLTADLLAVDQTDLQDSEGRTGTDWSYLLEVRATRGAAVLDAWTLTIRPLVSWSDTTDVDLDVSTSNAPASVPAGHAPSVNALKEDAAVGAAQSALLLTAATSDSVNASSVAASTTSSTYESPLDHGGVLDCLSGNTAWFGSASPNCYPGASSGFNAANIASYYGKTISISGAGAAVTASTSAAVAAGTSVTSLNLTAGLSQAITGALKSTGAGQATGVITQAGTSGLTALGAAQLVATSNVSLTAPGSTFDGQTVTASGTRILLAGQTTASKNGVYVWSGPSSALVRATDANTAAEVTNCSIYVSAGSVYSGTYWRQTASVTTIDSSAQAWSLYGEEFDNAVTAAGATSVTIRASAFLSSYPAGSTLTFRQPLVTTITSSSSMIDDGTGTGNTVPRLVLADSSTRGGTFGYVTGSDNHDAIMAAVATGKPVWLDPGVWLSSQLTLPGQTVIQGPVRTGLLNTADTHRGATLMLMPAANTPIITPASTGQLFVFRDLQIDGNAEFQTNPVSMITASRTSSDEVGMKFYDCGIFRSAGDGASPGNNTRGHHFDKCVIFANCGSGVSGGGTDTWVSFCGIGANLLDGVSTASQSWTITANNIWGNRNGIYISGSTVRGFGITNNFIDANRCSNVKMSGADSVLLSNNWMPNGTVSQTGAYATVELVNNCTGVRIADNYFYLALQNNATVPPFAIRSDSTCDWEDGGNTMLHGHAPAYVGGAGLRRKDADRQAGNQLPPGIWVGAEITSTGTVTPTQDQTRGSRIVIGRDTPITGLAINVGTAGSTGAVFRLGIARWNPDTQVATQLLDAGTVPATAVGVQTITLAAPLAVLPGDHLILHATAQNGATPGTALTTVPAITSIYRDDKEIGVTAAGSAIPNAFAGWDMGANTGAITAGTVLTTTARSSGGVPRVMCVAAA